MRPILFPSSEASATAEAMVVATLPPWVMGEAARAAVNSVMTSST
ncbi:Uncharacterised protein [Mycobacteroides abscessus]|nr:Uncharacterised protein [Mycobacteroides abscessus]